MIQTDAFGLDAHSNIDLQSIARQVRDIARSDWMPPGEILDRMPDPPRCQRGSPDMYQLTHALWQLMHAGMVDFQPHYLGGRTPGGDPPYRGFMPRYRWVGDQNEQTLRVI